MESLTLLVLLSTAMFLGCYLAGLIPLAVTFSEKKLRLITVLGAGLLVGTSLAVILPEGVEAIYKVKIDDVMYQKRLDQRFPSAAVPVVPGGKDANQAVSKLKDQPSKDHSKPALVETSAKKLSTEIEKPTGPARRKRGAEADEKPHQHEKEEIMSEQHSHDHHSHGKKSTDHEHEHSGVETHSVIGLTLVSGFILMLIVDQVSQRRSSSPYGADSAQRRNSVTATIGLVVHAAADGIALGAASNASHSDIQLIVFIAIMLHKAPASFGLVSFLLHEGLERTRIKKHLLAFALAAPIAAIVTTMGISQSGSESWSSSLQTTGILMLFSAGTFLYVATVHVLPEIVSHGASHLPVMEQSSGAHGGSFTGWELLALTAGALLPAFMSLGHSH